MREEIVLYEADPTSKDGRELIAELDDYLLTIYPESVCYRTPPEDIKKDGVFYIAKLDNEAVGCGGLKENDTGGIELKRMFVRPGFRGKGIASKLLNRLEHLSIEQGYKSIFLETGPPQIEAVRLYLKSGYFKRGPFGGYKDHPLSIFMEKRFDNEPYQSNGSAS
ncbi:GNAT family N-acetyltransferase [Hirschia maritima]|uniref:GNAT family N-acetyltransferase n=1 Tax=Hirschia maritima TaxID=1121961 RepID=UPI00037B9D52|nr:GNAT family N-acetyltransferase [Hirschia maritima]